MLFSDGLGDAQTSMISGGVEGNKCACGYCTCLKHACWFL